MIKQSVKNVKSVEQIHVDGDGYQYLENRDAAISVVENLRSKANQIERQISICDTIYNRCLSSDAGFKIICHISAAVNRLNSLVNKAVFA